MHFFVLIRDLRKISVILLKIDVKSINYSAFDSSDVALFNGWQITKSKNYEKCEFLTEEGGP